MYAGVEDDFLDTLTDLEESFRITVYRQVQVISPLGEVDGTVMTQIAHGRGSWYEPDEPVKEEKRGQTYRLEARYFLPPDWPVVQGDYLWTHTQPVELWRIEAINNLRTHLEVLCIPPDAPPNQTYARGCAGVTALRVRS